MSVTIMYRPIEHGGTYFRGGTSDKLETLKDLFGDHITKACIPELRAMAKASKDEFWGYVADIVEAEGDIEFWGDY